MPGKPPPARKCLLMTARSNLDAGMALGAIQVSQVPESGWPLALSTMNPSPRAGASGNETRVASVRNPKSKIENPKSYVCPSAILTRSRTRPSVWGSNARFGPVEDRRNNRRLATFTCTLCVLQIWWLSPFSSSVTFQLLTFQLLEAGPLERRGCYAPSSDCTVFRGNYCLERRRADSKHCWR